MLYTINNSNNNTVASHEYKLLIPKTNNRYDRMKFIQREKKKYFLSCKLIPKYQFHAIKKECNAYYKLFKNTIK